MHTANQVSTLGGPVQHASHACKPWLRQRSAQRQFLRQRHRRRIQAVNVAVFADANKKPLVVVGSINADMMLQVDRFPKPGETLSAKSMTTSAGGKVYVIV